MSTGLEIPILKIARSPTFTFRPWILAIILALLFAIAGSTIRLLPATDWIHGLMACGNGQYTTTRSFFCRRVLRRPAEIIHVQWTIGSLSGVALGFFGATMSQT